MGGLGVGSVVHRHAAAPWTAWRSIIPTLTEATESTDIDSLFAPTPILRTQLHQLQVTLSQQMDKPSLLLKSLGVALRTHGSQKTLVNTIQQVTHQQLLNSLSTNNIQKAILISQTAKNTGAHLQQPHSEAYEADDRCCQVSLDRRLMLLHPAASHSANISPTCPNVSAAKRICACPIDPHQLHCMTCKSGGGVDQRHSALARCLADLITTHTGTKAHIEQSIPGLAHTDQHGQIELARMDIVVALRGVTYYIDTAIVSPFSSNVSLMTAASARPGYMAEREEKKKFDRYPRINLVPFILESTGRPGYHARKFIKHLYDDTDHPPTAIRDAWAAIQTTLHNSISNQQLRAVTT